MSEVPGDVPGPRSWLPGTAIALSIAANAFLIYAVDRALSREPRSIERSRGTVVEEEDVVVGDDPYDVQLVKPTGLTLLSGIEFVALPASTASSPAAIAPTVVATARIGTGRAAGGAAATGGGTEGSTVEPGGTGTGPGSGLFGMRGRRHDLSLSGDAAARILGTSYELPDPVEPTGRIRGGKIDDKVATVTVHKDGTVDLKGKPHIEVHVGVPIPTLKDLRRFGEDIATWYEDPYKRARAIGRMQDVPTHITAVPGACDKWNDAWCTVPPSDGEGSRGRIQQSTDGGGLPLIWGKLDITGWLMEKTVGDAYASRKLKLLDSTREERIAAGTAYRAQRQARSAEYVQKNLEALWRTTTDAAARRAALFAMWDECTEDEAGLRARAMVIGWIRSHLPSGSPGAYSAEETAKLDAGRGSTQHFAPY